MGTKIFRILLTGAVVLLAACAGQPERLAELDQARAQVERAEREPMVHRVARRELENAKLALADAEQAWETNKKPEIVRHYAYQASKTAEIAQERAEEARAREAIKDSAAERNRVLLGARTEEAEERARDAEAARGRAEASRMRAEEAQSVAEAERTSAEEARAAAEAERARAELADSRAAATLEEARRMEAELEALKAEKTSRGIVLTLGDVLFDTGKAQLKSGADSTMSRLADFMRDNPERNLMIEGHTDSRGSEDYNDSLSSRRADSVVEALAEQGVSRDRLQAQGLGERYPVATNDSPAGQQQNRRVEIVISDLDGSFPAAATR